MSAAEEPNDVAAEQCVLGGMLLSPTAITDVTEAGLRPSDHYRPAHQIIHEAITALYSRSDPVDAVTVAAELASRGELNRISGAGYLHTLIAAVPTAANAGYYARIVAGHAERRAWLAHASRITQAASDPAADLGLLRELATRQPDADDSSQSGLLAGLRNGEWLDKQNFPELRYAVPGLVPEGSTLFVGAPKIGKSWFVLSIGLAIASGGVALSGVKTAPARPVLYLALEDGDRRMQDRCRMLLAHGEPIPPMLNYLTRVQPGQVLAVIGTWLRQHTDEHPFVIIDTLGKVMPLALQGESSYQRDYRVGGELKRLIDAHPGASLLTNHHDRKAAAADFIDSVSGTHGLAGAADTIIVLTRDRNDRNGLLQVTGRDVIEGEYAVIFESGSWRLDGSDLDEAAVAARTRKATAGLGGRSAEYVALVNKHPGGIRLGDVAKSLGVEANEAGTYLSRLVTEGRLTRPGRGLYAPVESVERVERPGQSINPAFNTVLNPENAVTSENNTLNTFNTDAGTLADGHGSEPRACPRHQTRWGPHPNCPDCQALTPPPSCARCGGPTAPGYELCRECERSAPKET